MFDIWMAQCYRCYRYSCTGTDFIGAPINFEVGALNRYRYRYRSFFRGPISVPVPINVKWTGTDCGPVPITWTD